MSTSVVPRSWVPWSLCTLLLDLSAGSAVLSIRSTPSIVVVSSPQLYAWEAVGHTSGHLCLKPPRAPTCVSALDCLFVEAPPSTSVVVMYSPNRGATWHGAKPPRALEG